MAEKQPWYKNTVFVIVSDHCASSASETELLWINIGIQGWFSPLRVRQATEVQYTNVTDRCDACNTSDCWNFTYQSKFIGQDVFFWKLCFKGAYIATYQDLGYVKDDKLAIISPIKNIKQYQWKKRQTKSKKSGINIFYEEPSVQKTR